MDITLLNSSNLNTSFIQFDNNTRNELFFQLNSETEPTNLFPSKKSPDSSGESGESTDEDSISFTKLKKSQKHIKSKFSLNIINHVRKDIYGNIIEKGGKHRVSFKDNIKGQLLVEMTLIDVKQNSLRGKNYKKNTVCLEAKDKKALSGACTIF